MRPPCVSSGSLESGPLAVELRSSEANMIPVNSPQQKVAVVGLKDHADPSKISAKTGVESDRVRYGINYANFVVGKMDDPDTLIASELPELARVGLTEKEARQQGLEIRVGKLSVAAIPRAKTISKHDMHLERGTASKLCLLSHA